MSFILPKNLSYTSRLRYHRLYQGVLRKLWCLPALQGMTTAAGAASAAESIPATSFLTPSERYSASFSYMISTTPQRSNCYDVLLRRLLIDPRRSRIIAPLDSVTAFALIFTTFVTPFEVASPP